MRIAKNIKSFTDIIPNNVKLVAVSKTKSINLIESAYKAGQRDFGENKVQELVNKFENFRDAFLNAKIRAHFYSRRIPRP